MPTRLIGCPRMWKAPAVCRGFCIAIWWADQRAHRKGHCVDWDCLIQLEMIDCSFECAVGSAGLASGTNLCCSLMAGRPQEREREWSTTSAIMGSPEELRSTQTNSRFRLHLYRRGPEI